MLKTLYIENIAVIEKVSVDFGAGLNVLTGETGAGKSIIIDAINAVMGRRTSREIVRTGTDGAVVVAEFENIGSAAEEKLGSLGFECGDETLILQRTVNANGKSSCKIGGRPASVSMLRELAPLLINIHGQHESYELFSPDTHLNYIDGFGGCEPLLHEYKQYYDEFKILKKKLNDANTDESARLREIDVLEYQLSELDAADVQPGEEESLTNERTALMNFEKVSSLLMKAKASLEGDDGNGGLDAVDIAVNALESAAAYDGEAEELAESMSNAYYELRDCCAELTDLIDSLEADPARLEEIEERLDLINRLCRKYNLAGDELGGLAERFRARLDELTNSDRSRGELEEQCQAAERKMLAAARKLSDARQKCAVDFAARVKEEMTFLNMPNARLAVNFEACEPCPAGIDKAELLISANPGEALRPVAKIASGGELSRIMLAVKTVLAGLGDADTLIFDEVDTGVSGSAAEKVGLKLKEVSRGCQVLCVTHRAQIAALADSHYLIRKDVRGGRTFTSVLPLDRQGRIEELARITGGVTVTEADLKHAESMLDRSNVLPLN